MKPNTETQATARPWRLRGPSSVEGANKRAVATAHVHIDTKMPKESNAENNANAALIVRAVNAHDALVAALEALLQVYEPRVAITGHSAVLWSQARAALAAAKGGA